MFTKTFTVHRNYLEQKIHIRQHQQAFQNFKTFTQTQDRQSRNKCVEQNDHNRKKLCFTNWYCYLHFNNIWCIAYGCSLINKLAVTVHIAYQGVYRYKVKLGSWCFEKYILFIYLCSNSRCQSMCYNKTIKLNSLTSTTTACFSKSQLCNITTL